MYASDGPPPLPPSTWKKIGSGSTKENYPLNSRVRFSRLRFLQVTISIDTYLSHILPSDVYSVLDSWCCLMDALMNVLILLAI